MTEQGILMDALVGAVAETCIEHGIESPRFAVCFFPPDLPHNAFLMAANVPPEMLGMRHAGALAFSSPRPMYWIHGVWLMGVGLGLTVGLMVRFWN